MNAKTLRNSILQFAIEGKLVPQNSQEASASELIEEIIREKQRLRVNTRLKMTKPLSPSVIEDSDVPFNIPSSWEWVKIEDIYYNHGQKKPDQDFQYIDVASVNNIKGVIKDDLEPISADAAPSRARKIVSNGDVIYSTVRPYLQNIAIVTHDTDNNYDLIASTAFVVMKLIKVFNEYLYFALKSPYFTQLVENQMQGVAYPAINERTFNSLLIPLPPLEEQYRIVNKIKELFYKVDEFEDSHYFLQKLQEQFPLQLEHSILQYAIEGKLVEQNTSDERASKLLKRISEQKEQMFKEKVIKKEKSLPPIAEEEIPFDIPDTWEWVRLQEVALITMGQSPEGTSVGEDIDGIEFHQGKSLFSKMYLTKSNQNTSNPKKIANAHSIIMSVRAPVGDVNILKDRSICIGRGLASIEPLAGIDLYYLNYYLQWAKPILENKSTGSTFKAVNLSTISHLTVPLPPTNEQIKIVEEIENMSNSIRNLSLLNQR